MTADRIRTVFMGSPAFAVPALRRLVADSRYRIAAVYAQPDRPSGRGRALAQPAVKRAALELGLPVEQPAGLRKAEASERLRELQPDLIVVAAYGQILRPAVIDLPRFGCLNIHASLLPRHRGASAVAAAILAGDTETGVSIMQIDPGMDTGPVLTRRATAILNGDSTGTLTARLAELGADLLIETLPGWIAGEVQAAPQDAAHATYAPPLSKEMGAIDWTKPAIRIWREVRGFNPWPLATTMFRQEPLQILEATPLDADGGGQDSIPGQIVELRPWTSRLETEVRKRAGFAVATGRGLLVPVVVRRAGRKAMTGAEFARGTRDLLGSQLL